MKLGYACLNVTMGTKVRTCRLKTYINEGNKKAKEITLSNIEMIEDTLLWNVKKNIFMFRTTSNIIPLGTHELFNWDWKNDTDIIKAAHNVKEIVDFYGIRLTSHPGEYTVLNSIREDIVNKAYVELQHHQDIMGLLGGKDMILHTGGAYGDKEAAKIRFAENYKKLSKEVKANLRLENDDKTFTVKDVLDVHKMCGVPICLDIHHHKCNNDDIPIEDLIDDVFKSWNGFGTPKFHISSGKNHEKDNAHHNFVHQNDFDYFINVIGNRNADIMFEAKQKELSILKIKTS
ncbi:UV DNA damage endonuclease [compost metagenome]